VRATPSDAVTFFVDLDPVGLRHAGATLRDQIAGYEAAAVPATAPWDGSAAESYGAAAAALNGHLFNDGSDSMVGRLRATASYVDSVAEWCQVSRDQIARALATVLSSGQAVTLRLSAGRGHGVATADGGVAGAVIAAADIGAMLLGVAEDAIAAGRDLLRSTSSELAELTYRPYSMVDPVAHRGSIRLHQ
jgi:hypothetical protein